MNQKQRHFICCFFVLFSMSFVTLFYGNEKEIKADITNSPEVTVRNFSYFEDFISYLKKGGMLQYSPGFKGDYGDRYIKLNIKKSGTLMLTNLTDDCGTLYVYTDNMQRIGSFDSEDSFLKLQIKPGVYYIKLPQTKKTIALSAMVYEDHLRKIAKDRTMLQSGTGAYDYHEFSIPGRRMAVFELEPVISSKHSVYSYLEKWNGKRWAKITKRRKRTSNTSTTTLYGLSKGRYRIRTKTSTKQGFTMQYHLYQDKAKYAKKKSKALKLKVNAAKSQIFTATESGTRWYQLKRKTVRRRHYINFTSDVNSGNLKVYIYKKGRKRPIKTLKLRGNNPSEAKKYRFRQGVGTYYIKVKKENKYANGNYYIFYSIE